MGIQKLSQELWDDIVLATQKYDWKSLRLVCRRFEHQASACLFLHISVCLQQNSLDRLIGVADSPRLCQHIRILTIGDEILSKRAQVSPASFVTGLQKIHLGIAPLGHQYHHKISWDYFQSTTLADFPASTYPEGLNKIGLNRAQALGLYAKHGYMAYEHSKLINQNLDIWILAAAFSKLERLNTVHLSISNKTNRKRSWGSTSDSPYILTSEEHHDRQLHVFLGAAAACSPVLKITNLVIDDDDEGVAVATDRGIGEISTYLIRAALPSLNCIACLDIPIGKYSESGHNGHGPAILRIAELLRGLPFLERFSLRNNERNGIFPIEVASILAAISSNRLQSITLEGCFYRAHRFKAFLMKHGARLRKIRIRWGFLAGCTFESLFRFMRTRLLLEELVLNSSFIEVKEKEKEYDSSIKFMPSRASKDDAMGAISAFVTRKSIHYPSDLVNKDPKFILLGTSSGHR
ncbi:hypothetical protein BDZ45DRAFT_802342 [Acephala macrosclerotiorum]|nr:hypothetical protein BDZ45DRAFT_802342 [Acephala macrosclerotiorum]